MQNSNRVNERIWRCDCGGPHFVAVTKHEWEGGQAYFSLEDYSYSPSWRERISSAWDALRGERQHGAEIILSSQTAFDIAAELVDAGQWLKKQKPDNIQHIKESQHGC